MPIHQNHQIIGESRVFDCRPPCRSRIADQNRSRRSCPPELLWIRAGWQRALTSSAGSQTTPVESPPRRSVPGSALTPPGPPGPGWMELKAGASCLHLSVFPPFVPAGVDTSVVPSPREADQETSPIRLLPLPQTSPRLFPELRRWPWLTD